jgi:tetratricopeptide (TPR) repeat protein
VNRSASADRSQSERILAAHKEALRVYKIKRFEGKNPFQFLEEGGIWRILDAKPMTMSMGEYVNVLNDYAYLAYQYGEGRTDLAIEILDKVIKLSPRRAPAYLNMAEALEYLAKFGATEYATIPLDDTTITALRARAATYRDKHRSIRGQPRKDG